MDTANLDQLAKALLNIGTYKGTTCKMINEMIAKEFNTTQEHTILRGNSVTTKLEMLFCRMYILSLCFTKKIDLYKGEQGKSYLKTLFGQTVLRLVTDCDLNLATTITFVFTDQNTLLFLISITGNLRTYKERQRRLALKRIASAFWMLLRSLLILSQMKKV